MTAADTSAAMSLRLTLPGSWLHLDVDDPEASRKSIGAFTERLLPRNDASAQARGLIHFRAMTALEEASGTGLSSIFIAGELAPGVPLPVTLTVADPPQLQMSPALGTSPRAVLAALRGSLERMHIDGARSAHEIHTDKFAALRIEDVSRTSWSEAGFGDNTANENTKERFPRLYDDDARAAAGAITLEELRADYWCTVPASKRVVLMTFRTTFGAIPHTMIGLFDSIVKTAKFGEPTAPK